MIVYSGLIARISDQQMHLTAHTDWENQRY
jgi:hypothetical protein